MIHSKNHLIRPGYYRDKNKYFSKINDNDIVAYVENYDDIDFWNEIFKRYLPLKVKVTTNIGSANGKDALLANLQNTAEDIIICMDSDLDYLLKNRSKKSNIICNHNCVFHTYTYSMENYRCYAESLNELCIKISNSSPDKEFNIVNFVYEFSKIIHEPFTYFLYFDSINDTDSFKWSEFENIIKIDNDKSEKIEPDEFEKLLKEILKNIENKFKRKLVNKTIDPNKLKCFQEKLNKFILDPLNTYLFIKGHTLFDNVIIPLIEKVVSIYCEREIRKIKKRFKNKQIQCNQEISHYANVVEQVSIKSQLKANNNFFDCFLMENIKKDIYIFIQKFYPEYQLGEESFGKLGIGKSWPKFKRKQIKLFLACSAEMNDEGEKIDLLISKENRKLYNEGISLDIVNWKNLMQGFQGNRVQDGFNQDMLKCDIVIFLFFTNVGVYTREEYDVAYQNFINRNKPHYILVFFKSGNINIKDILPEEIQTIKELQEEIDKNEQIYTEFRSTEELILQLGDQLDLIVREIVDQGKIY